MLAAGVVLGLKGNFFLVAVLAWRALEDGAGDGVLTKILERGHAEEEVGVITVKLAPLIICQGLVRLGGLGDGVGKEDALDGGLRRVEQGPGPALCTNCTGRGSKLGLLDGTRWHPPPDGPEVEGD